MNENLIQEILEELRITKETIEVMAQGYSPNSIGAIDISEGDEIKFIYRYPVVQLSQKLAKKLMELYH